MKKIVHIDMDDTIADFMGSEAFKNGFDVNKMYEVGFFLNLKPIPGALSGVRALIRKGYDVQICSQPVAESAHSYSEKVQWIALWFPELITKVNFTQDKGIIKGDYLIDDNQPKWQAKFEALNGEYTFVHFDHKNPEKNWESIVKML